MTNDRFINRELSWLEFNRRVLEEAQDPTVPLLERVKFLAIFSSNLDEFFMVRMAGLKRQLFAGDRRRAPDGMNAADTIAAVSAKVHELVALQHRVFLEEIQPLARGRRRAHPPFQGDHGGAAPIPRRLLPPHACCPCSRRWPSIRAIPFRTSAIARCACWPPSGDWPPHHCPRRPLAVVHIPSQVVPRFVAMPDQPQPPFLHAAGGHHPVASSAALPRLRDTLLARHPGDPRRGAAAAARAGRGSSHQHRGESARSTHGLRRAAAVRHGPAGARSVHPAGGAGAAAGGSLRGPGLHDVFRSHPALCRPRYSPAQGSSAAAASRACLRGGAGCVECHSQERRPRSPPVSVVRRGDEVRARSRRRSARCWPSR